MQRPSKSFGTIQDAFFVGQGSHSMTNQNS